MTGPLDNLNTLADWLSRTPVRADCFFVTLAVLLGTNVLDLANHLRMPVPPPGSTGMLASQMVYALRTLGLSFRIWRLNFEDGPSGGGPIRNPRVYATGASESVAHSVFGNFPRVLGVAYVRPDGTGHVVICRSPGTPYRRYLDYQARRGGADASRDAQNSRIVMFFGIDPQASSGAFFNLHRHQIEQMEWDDNVQLCEPMDVDESHMGVNNSGPGPSWGHAASPWELR